jgi:hypothetical protein
LALCTIRRKDNLKKMLQMFPDDDIRETIINYADGAGEENTVNERKHYRLALNLKNASKMLFMI